jgi:CcmD family protein
MQNGPYLFAAYSIVWAVVFGYILFLFTKQQHLNKEIKALKEEIKEKQDK